METLVVGEGFERGAGGVLAGGDEFGGEFIRDGEGHLHGLRIAFGLGGKNAVVMFDYGRGDAPISEAKYGTLASRRVVSYGTVFVTWSYDA